MQNDAELRKQAQAYIDQYRSLWKGLSTKEFSLSIDFINSPMHKASHYVAELANHLNIAFRRNEIALPNDDNLVRRYSGGRKTQSIGIHLEKLNEQLETILKLTEQFLVYHQVMEDKSLYHRALVKSLKERTNNELFLKAATDFRVYLNKKSFTLMVAGDKWWLEHQCYYHKYADHASDQDIFDRNINSFDSFKQLVLLRNYLELLNRNVYDKKKIEKFEEALHEIKHQDESRKSVINLYLQLIQILKSKNEFPNPYYSKFKQNFYQAEYDLAKVDQLVLCKICTNYLYGVYFQLDDPWLKEAFEWMKYSSLKGFYAFDGTTSDDEYLNFVLISMALDEDEALVHFQKTYTKLLDESIKTQVLVLCESYALLKKQKIKEAFQLLDKTFPLHSQKHLKYDVRAKELRIMLAYENKELKGKHEDVPDALENYLENLKKYCDRIVEKGLLSEEKAAPHANFRRIAAKFFLLQNKPNDRGKARTIKEIQQSLNNKEPLSNRTWVKKQLARLNSLPLP